MLSLVRLTFNMTLSFLTFLILFVLPCLITTNFAAPTTTTTTTSTTTKSKSKSLLHTETRKCPCTFHITTSFDSPPLDFIVQSVRLDPTRRSDRIQESFSRFSQDSQHAFHKDGLLLHYKVRVPILATVRLSVHEHGKLGVPNHALVNILPDIKQATNCPVTIPYDPPSESVRSVIASRIIGGQRANLQLAKYLVFIATFDSAITFAMCTGSVIGPRTILTAAHCEATPDSIVVIGETIVEQPLESSLEVQSFNVHPEYSRSSREESVQYDIAYITLTEDLPANIPVLKVNTDNILPRPFSPVRAIGYGLITEDESVVREDIILNQVDLIADSHIQCQLKHRNVDVFVSAERVLCASGPQEGCGICSGDSGGPLLYYDSNGEAMVVGVVSASVICGSAIFPALYVRTAGHLDFLQITPSPLPSGATPYPSLSPSPKASSTPGSAPVPPSGISPETRNIIIIAAVAAVVVLIIVVAVLCVCCS